MTDENRTSIPTSPLRVARKVVVAVVGATVVALGVALIVLPGPAIVFIPIGLAILATELLWARRLLRRVKTGATRWFGGRQRLEGASPILSSGRPLMFAMVTVVFSFLGSLWFSHFRLSAIDAQALGIASKAAPSIEHLSAARGELRRLGMYANEYATDVPNGRPISRNQIEATRGRLTAELAGHRQLPDFPNEVELATAISRDLGALDQALRKALEEADARQFAAARVTLHGDFHQTLERVDESMRRLVQLDLESVRVKVAQITETRNYAMNLAFLLGGISVFAAIIASVIALLVLRRQGRLMEDHNRLREARATELEAFAGRVAHDLKNPLGAIALRLMCEQRRPETDPRLRDTFDKVARQVDRMDHIINGLLEFALAGANPPPGLGADVEAVLKEVLSEVRPGADNVNAELVVEPFPSTRVACTPGALTSVLSNLIGNAVKYIVEGRHPVRRITVHVKDRTDAVRVDVKDNGPGLPPGSERLVFEPFQRLAETSQPGTGIGLATVKKIVEAYQGRVGVDSTLGEGSTFWFELPKAQPPDEAPRGTRGPTAGSVRPEVTATRMQPHATSLPVANAFFVASEFAIGQSIWARRLLGRLHDGTNRALRRPIKEKVET